MGDIISQIIKQFLWLVIPSSLALFALAFLVYSGESQKRNSALTENEMVNISFAKTSLERALDSAITDLQFLTDLSTNKTLDELGHDFLLFSQQKKIYDQIRFISIDGREQVRINYRNGEIHRVPEAGLQNKKRRYYFKYTAVLEKGAFFISPLDLNIERGMVERPLKPMIRLAMVVYDAQGQKRGIVILNYLAKDMLQRFRNHAKKLSGSLRLINNDGFWLSHEKWEKEWGFMLERNDRIQAEHPKEWSRIQPKEMGQFKTDNGLFTFVTVHPVVLHQNNKNKKYSWKILTHVPAKIIGDEERHKIFLTLLIAGPVYFAMLIVCAWLAYSRVQRLHIEKDLRVSEERNRAIINMSLDAIMTTDHSGRVEAWNPAAEDMFGYDLKEAMGKQINGLIIPMILAGTWVRIFHEYFLFLLF